jgi:hypothetical protein
VAGTGGFTIPVAAITAFLTLGMGLASSILKLKNRNLSDEAQTTPP